MADYKLLQELPFDSEVVEQNGDEVVIRSKIKCEADADAWISAYQRVSSTNWNVRKTYPRLERIRYRKDYVCHHSSFQKVNNICLH